MRLPMRSDTQISKPILFPDKEQAQFNGFALTSWGIVLQSSVFTTRIEGGASQWMGTQS
jgi:hypothetical protein